MKEKLAITDLTMGDVAIIRMALQDSVILAEKYHEKFVNEKRSKKMIKQAKWNIEQARKKINYFENKIQYSQLEWILDYFRLFSDNETYQHVKYSLGKVKWF
tara:strand:- start:124 stop:429 length:306 start_codon:yes stop_codon:yes gene_type:complete